MCFDSNFKYVDRKLLWKMNNSVYKKCSTLFNVSKVIEEGNFPGLKYILISTGCNDLDVKSHAQVYGEMELLLDQIRSKFKGVKVIINEITPRNDNKDIEVKHLNQMLAAYVANHSDTTIAEQSNLRDPTWSMYEDKKHIAKQKIAKYASNII